MTPEAAAHATPADLFRRLAELDIAVTTTEHPPVFTVEESRQLRGNLPGAHCKNLFLKDKKDQLWLVVVLEEGVLDLKELRQHLGAAHLSFGKPEVLQAVLGVTPGAVTPFALINDHAQRVRVALDAHMLQQAWLNYHPLTNAATTTIASADFLRFVQACGHAPLLLQLGPAAH